MDFMERSYSLLLVSRSAGFIGSLRSLLSYSSYEPISSVSTLVEARRSMEGRTYDIILVDYQGYEDGLESCRILCSYPSTMVLVFLPSELYPELSPGMVQEGIFSLQKPLSRNSFLSAMEFLKTCCNRMGSLVRRSDSLEERLEEMKLSARAKLLLMEKHGLSEEAANRYILKLAMDKGLKKKEVCKLIIRKFVNTVDNF